MLLQLTDDFLSVVNNLLGVNEETLQGSQGIANTSAKQVLPNFFYKLVKPIIIDQHFPACGGVYTYNNIWQIKGKLNLVALFLEVSSFRPILELCIENLLELLFL